MDEAILKAAKHVYDHIDDDVDISAELEILQSHIEDNGELVCDGFVVNIEEVASYSFNDEELLDSLEDTCDDISDAMRISYMREKLESKLEGWETEDSSLSVHEFNIAGDCRLVLLGLVTIDGYSPVVQWLRPVKNPTTSQEHLNDIGIITSIEDLNAISDTHLLSLWH